MRPKTELTELTELNKSPTSAGEPWAKKTAGPFRGPRMVIQIYLPSEDLAKGQSPDGDNHRGEPRARRSGSSDRDARYGFDFAASLVEPQTLAQSVSLSDNVTGLAASVKSVARGQPFVVNSSWSTLRGHELPASFPPSPSP